MLTRIPEDTGNIIPNNNTIKGIQKLALTSEDQPYRLKKITLEIYANGVKTLNNTFDIISSLAILKLPMIKEKIKKMIEPTYPMAKYFLSPENCNLSIKPRHKMSKVNGIMVINKSPMNEFILLK